jgi:circadian clock protein KaiC
VSGSAGSGKTLLGLDFLINGAVDYKERGVFMSFEETEEELYKDVASLNLDLRGLVSQKKICSNMCFWSVATFKRVSLISKAS